MSPAQVQAGDSPFWRDGGGHELRKLWFFFLCFQNMRHSFPIFQAILWVAPLNESQDPNVEENLGAFDSSHQPFDEGFEAVAVGSEASKS